MKAIYKMIKNLSILPETLILSQIVEANMDKISPKAYTRFAEEYPEVFKSYEEFANQCHQAGTLDSKTRRLVKLAIAIALGSEGAVHSNTRRALQEGLSAGDLRHIAILAMPSIGLPKSQAALCWINDILDSE